ncbi:MAG: type II secretion system F family protein [Alphaproteobacteria bacterium]|nr:type II secretion system F family protein [Alphaproteobacteria bacterium]
MTVVAGLNVVVQVLTFLFAVVLTVAVSDRVSHSAILRRRLGGEIVAAVASRALFLKTPVLNSRFLRWVQSSSSIAEPKEHRKLARSLVLAGFEHPAAPVWYVISRFSVAIGLPFVFLIGERLLGRPTGDAVSIFGALFFCAIGLLLPRAYIDRRVESRRAQLAREFPDALDLMVVCIEAGLGLTAAFVRVAHEMKPSYPMITGELERVSERFRAGQSQSEALRAMADHCDVPAIKSFVALLIQTVSIGTSIAQSLRVYAKEVREARMLKAEERALRIPVLMTVPLITCILPVIVVALTLPAIIDVVRVLIPAMRAAGHP